MERFGLKPGTGAGTVLPRVSVSGNRRCFGHGHVTRRARAFTHEDARHLWHGRAAAVARARHGTCRRAAPTAPSSARAIRWKSTSGSRRCKIATSICFHRVLLDHLDEFLPVVYTPTSRAASARSSATSFAARAGLWITPEHRGRSLRRARRRAVRRRAPYRHQPTTEAGSWDWADAGRGRHGDPDRASSRFTPRRRDRAMATLPLSLDVGTDNAQPASATISTSATARRDCAARSTHRW